VSTLINRIKQVLPQGKLFRSIGFLVGSTAIGQLLVVLASPVLTRLYTPHDLGVIGLITSFLAVSTLLVTLRLEQAIVSAISEEDANGLAQVALVLSLILSALSSLLLYPLISLNLLGFGAVSYWAVPLVFVASCFTGWSSTLRYWLIRQKNFTLVGRMVVWQNLARVLGQISLGLFSLGWLGLTLGECAARGFGIRPAWVLAHKTLKLKISSKDFFVIGRYSPFPKYVLPSSLVDALAYVLPLPMVASEFGVASAGAFALAQRVVTIPVSLIGASVADVFHAQIAEAAREKPHTVRAIFWSTSRYLLVLGLLFSIPLVLLSPILFEYIFGQNWKNAGWVAAAMSPWMLAQFVVSPISRLVLVSDRQIMKLLYDLVSLLIVVAVPIVAARAGLNLIETIIWLSAFQVLAYSLYYLVLYLLVQRMSR